MKGTWRASSVLIGFACAASAQSSGQITQSVAPVGIIRGDLVKWSGTPSRGELDIRGADANVVTCGFDAKTYFERDNQRIAPPAMSAGDRIEMVADRKPGATACYARTVHVIDPSLAQRASTSRMRPRDVLNPTETFAPRGDLTYAGVIIRVNPDSLTVRTRSEGPKMLLLRRDTRYLAGGVRVDPTTLKVSTRVFIRAGRNLDGDVEAYQVIWGDIVRP